MTEMREGRLPIKPPGCVPCWYCGKSVNKAKTWDHIIPKSRGGVNLPVNLVIACKECNCDKANMTLDEYRRYHWLKANLQVARVLKVVEFITFWGETEEYQRGIPHPKGYYYATI